MIESYSYRRNDDYLRDVSRGGVVGAEPVVVYGRRGTSGADSGVLWPDGALTDFEGNDLKSQGIFLPISAAGFQDASATLSIPCPIVFTEGQAVGMTFMTDKASTIVGSWFGWLENE